MAKNWPILALFILFGIHSQSQIIFFDQLTTADGLPSDYVNCIFEDSKGYLWIGTDKGACRYDGRQFQYFNNDNGLPANFVTCFAEDSTGNIWIGTINTGMCKYDGKTVLPFSLPENKDANIVKIQFNSDNSFFVLSNRPNIGKPGGQIVLYFFQNERSEPQVYPDMAFLKTIQPGLFVTGSLKQLFTIELKNQQPIFRDLPHPRVEDGHLFYWLHDSKVMALKKNAVLEYSTDGQRWFLTKEFLIDRSAFLPEWTQLKDVLVNNNELFIATVNGLIHIDAEKKVYLFKAENGLGANFIRSVYKDKKSNIYICTFGAGVKIWPARYLEEFKTNGKVTSVFPSDKTAFITTTKTSYELQSSSGQLNELKNLNDGSFTSIYKDSKGDVYLGTLNNYYKLPAGEFSNKTRVINRAKPQRAHAGASGFIAYKNDIYVATYGDGIFRLNGVNKKVDTINASSNQKAPLIVEFLVPLHSSFAALTYNSGLTIFDSLNGSTSLTKSDGLLSNTVYSAFQEKDNEIWIGTQNGLNLFIDKKIVKTFTSADGLVGTKVLCIFRDATKRFWILSDKFLHLLENDRLRTIRSHRILYDEKNPINRATYDPASNTLFIGLTDALLTVNIGRIIPDTIIDIPRLSAVRKDSSIYSFSGDRSLSLSRSVSNITFQFDHNYSFGHRSDLYYKLSGFDDDWKILTNATGVDYPKLPAGRYQLMAKTINSDGYESAELNLLNLEVKPPLWKRGWFMTLIAVSMLAIFFYIGNTISKRRYNRKLRHLQEEYRLQLERERIARELHDNVGSQLTYLINKIDDDHTSLADKAEAKKLSRFARGTMQELRETIWALNKKQVPPDELENKIRQLTRLYKKEKQDLELYWHLNDGEKQSLKSLEALNIYRIVQEALNNAEKYSSATYIRIEANNFENSFSIQVKDNGKGFDINNIEKGFGLQNMYKRAEEMNAEIKIESSPGMGTLVQLRLNKNQPFS